MRAVFIFLLFSGLAVYAQPRRVEVWGNVGAARVGGDEAWNGGGFIYGGGVALPLARRLAVEVDVARVKVSRFNEAIHTLISPAVVWRWGSERLYGFVGGGLGTEGTNSTFGSTDYNMTLHGRGGAVFSPNNRVFVRAEVFSSFQYALPTAGVKIGFGYRF